MKQLKDYLPFYLGCEIYQDDIKYKLVGFMPYRALYKNPSDETRIICVTEENQYDEFPLDEHVKISLRPSSDLKADDFYSFGLPGKGQILITATINKMWCSGLYDVKEYDERIENELSVDPNDLLYELEESDFDNVLSCTKTGQIAYGTSDEMRYFVELETLSKWVNHLRKRQIDVDGLIKAGLAIDATTYADKRSVATTDSHI